MLKRNSKERLQIQKMRNSRTHWQEVRWAHSSVEAGQCPWSEGAHRISLTQTFLDRLSEDNKSRQR